MVRKPVDREKLFIVGTATIIAVLANVTRIVVTAVRFEIARCFPSLSDADKGWRSRTDG